MTKYQLITKKRRPLGPFRLDNSVEAKPIKTREEEHALLSAKKGHHARMNFGGKGLETLL